MGGGGLHPQNNRKRSSISCDAASCFQKYWGSGFLVPNGSEFIFPI